MNLEMLNLLLVVETNIIVIHELDYEWLEYTVIPILFKTVTSVF